MKAKSILAAMLLLVAGLQTAWAQGFRVYKSDGTIMQFSLRTDSIVFYDGIGTDVDFGPFTPVNQCIVGTWYKSKSESVTFREDGTTDYISGGTYQFFPYQGNIIISNASGAPMNILKVYNLTSERMLVGTPGSVGFHVWSTSPLPIFVQEIRLSNTTLNMAPDKTRNLTATVLPVDAENPEVTWSSSNKDVAEVSKKGKVIANDEGTCIITCSATDGSGVYAECLVTVSSSSSSSDGEVNSKYCNLRARLTIDNVLQVPVLFTACESMGEYCTIKSDGQRFTFTNASNTTSAINIPAISDYNGYYWLDGFIVGKLTIPEMGEDVPRVVCFDLACSNCYENYNITKPLRLQVGGYAKCMSCGRTYNLNDCGTISDGPAGRNLFRYRVSYIGNTLVINNGI